MCTDALECLFKISENTIKFHPKNKAKPAKLLNNHFILHTYYFSIRNALRRKQEDPQKSSSSSSGKFFLKPRNSSKGNF